MKRECFIFILKLICNLNNHNTWIFLFILFNNVIKVSGVKKIVFLSKVSPKVRPVIWRNSLVLYGNGLPLVSGECQQGVMSPALRESRHANTRLAANSKQSVYVVTHPLVQFSRLTCGRVNTSSCWRCSFFQYNFFFFFLHNKSVTERGRLQRDGWRQYSEANSQPILFIRLLNSTVSTVSKSQTRNSLIIFSNYCYGACRLKDPIM